MIISEQGSEMINQPWICERCSADNELRLEIKQRGTRVAVCPTCENKNLLALTAEDDRVRRIIRAMIRLHYSEWHYNQHIGGTSLYDLICAEKLIFDLDSKVRYPIPDDVWCPIEAGWYPESEEEITLGGGYWNGHYLTSLKGNHSEFARRLVRNALHKNHFEAEAEVRKKIIELAGYITKTIPAGTEYYRGRVGVASRLSNIFAYPGQPDMFRYQPYSGSAINRPPIHLAGEGRLNRNRVSVLYVASDVSTAISELRPHPGHLISTAKFTLEHEIKIADFSKFDIRDFLSDSKLEQLRDLISISDILNLPIQPEHRYLYSVTQLIADSLRLEGFDGLTFKSSIGPGVNLTCFVSDAFSLVKDSEEVYEIDALRYRFSKVLTLGSDFREEEYLRDEDSPLSTLLHGIKKIKR